MIKLWVFYLLLGFFLFSYCPMTLEKVPEKSKILVKRANFLTSLSYTLKREGFYSFHKNDKGGETYQGIARGLDLGSNWSGWKYIDQYKKTHEIKWNDSIPVSILTWKVHEYYVSIWVEEDFFSIQDQDIANYCFDTRINCTIGNKIIKKTLIEMNYPLLLNNNLDSITVAYINIAPKWEFLYKLNQNRLSFYTGIVDRHQDQLIFLNHWVKRSNIR